MVTRPRTSVAALLAYTSRPLDISHAHRSAASAREHALVLFEEAIQHEHSAPRGFASTSSAGTRWRAPCRSAGKPANSLRIAITKGTRAGVAERATALVSKSRPASSKCHTCPLVSGHFTEGVGGRNQLRAPVARPRRMPPRTRRSSGDISVSFRSRQQLSISLRVVPTKDTCASARSSARSRDKRRGQSVSQRRLAHNLSGHTF